MSPCIKRATVVCILSVVGYRIREQERNGAINRQSRSIASIHQDLVSTSRILWNSSLSIQSFNHLANFHFITITIVYIRFRETSKKNWWKKNQRNNIVSSGSRNFRGKTFHRGSKEQKRNAEVQIKAGETAICYGIALKNTEQPEIKNIAIMLHVYTR